MNALHRQQVDVGVGHPTLGFGVKGRDQPIAEVNLIGGRGEVEVINWSEEWVKSMGGKVGCGREYILICVCIETEGTF